MTTSNPRPARTAPARPQPGGPRTSGRSGPARSAVSSDAPSTAPSSRSPEPTHPWPAGPPSRPPRPSAGPTAPAQPGQRPPGRRRAELRRSAAAAAWALVTLLEEVGAGRRAPRQLRAVMRVDLAERWAQAPTEVDRAGRIVRVGPPQVHVRGGGPTAEVVVLVRVGARVLPTAIRLEQRTGRWWATDVVRPGRPQPPALPTEWSRQLLDEAADDVPEPAIRPGAIAGLAVDRP